MKLEVQISEKTPEQKLRISKQIERGVIANKIKAINGFQCQICKELKMNPLSFKKNNGEYYVETHHVIDVSKLQKGSLGVLNLITVCANHHRQIHYRNVELLSNNSSFFEFKIDEISVKIRKFSIGSQNPK